MAMACTRSLATASILQVEFFRTPAAAWGSLCSYSASAHCLSSSASCLAGLSSPAIRKCNTPVSGAQRVLDPQWMTRPRRRCDRRKSGLRAGALESGETALAEREWGPPIQLATGKIPVDVDLKLFETLLYQWGSSLTQNANLPLPVPLKVDRIAGGVRLGYVKVTDATVEEVCHIDVVVFPASDEEPKAMMRALRNGKLKDITPPAESLIMQSLLQALKTAVSRSRT